MDVIEIIYFLLTKGGGVTGELNIKKWYWKNGKQQEEKKYHFQMIDEYDGRCKRMGKKANDFNSSGFYFSFILSFQFQFLFNIENIYRNDY